MLTFFLMIMNIFLLLVAIYFVREFKVLYSIKKNYSSVVVLQKIMEVIGKKITGAEKMDEINDILIKENHIMYSTIVSYNGDEHIVEVSNVEAEYHEIYKDLIEDPLFKDNTIKNIPKYVASSNGESVKYSSARERGIRSAMFMPLYLEGVYAGYWIIEDKRLNAFDKFEKVQLSILKNNLVLIVENSNYQSTIEKMAVSDRLTGLYNRYYLYNKARLIINDFPISTVVIADIDHFKSINDNYGHDIGDKVLVNMVKTTLKYLTQADIFVRFGGEEFVILFPGKTPEQCRAKIDEIREIISRTQIPVGETNKINVTVSYGMSAFQHGANLDMTLKNADVALYKAKESGRNRVELA